MRFVRVIKSISDGLGEITLVNLSKVEVITNNDEGCPVLWIGDESWACPIQSLEDCIVEI